ASQFFVYVGETNREKIHNREIAYAFSNPIIDPKGTQDPFRYNIDEYYGASDHSMYLDATPRIPALSFLTWPDFGYHTSEDTPESMDPTQMKRVAFLAVALGHVLANAG